VTEVDFGASALLTLLPIGVVFGIGSSMIFSRCSDRVAVRRSGNRVLAYLLEFRLFLDEPRLILKAQKNLLIENLRWLRLLVKPVLVLTLPTIILLAQLDALYGHAPLVPGEAAVVTAQFGKARLDDVPRVVAPPGVVVETPPVRVESERQVSWRIRPFKAVSGKLQFVCQDRNLTKSIRSGAGVHYKSARRGNIWRFLLQPTELPLSTSVVDWIEIDYPRAVILHLNWLVWFLVASSVGAILGFRFAPRYFVFPLRASRA
jgi:hypothetical protein